MQPKARSDTGFDNVAIIVGIGIFDVVNFNLLAKCKH